jgi:large subunit ribosomal protein L30
MPSKKGPEAMLKITLLRSPIGTPKSHRLLLRALGLRRIRHTVTRPDTPQVNGLIHKLAYMVGVEKAAT